MTCVSKTRGVWHLPSCNRSVLRIRRVKAQAPAGPFRTARINHQRCGTLASIRPHKRPAQRPPAHGSRERPACARSFNSRYVNLLFFSSATSRAGLPVPARLALEKLWNAFCPSGKIRARSLSFDTNSGASIFRVTTADRPAAVALFDATNTFENRFNVANHSRDAFVIESGAVVKNLNQHTPNRRHKLPPPGGDNSTGCKMPNSPLCPFAALSRNAVSHDGVH